MGAQDVAVRSSHIEAAAHGQRQAGRSKIVRAHWRAVHPGQGTSRRAFLRGLDGGRFRAGMRPSKPGARRLSNVRWRDVGRTQKQTHYRDSALKIVRTLLTLSSSSRAIVPALASGFAAAAARTASSRSR